jgi:hypothetical protein
VGQLFFLTAKTRIARKLESDKARRLESNKGQKTNLFEFDWEE